MGGGGMRGREGKEGRERGEGGEERQGRERREEGGGDVVCLPSQGVHSDHLTGPQSNKWAALTHSSFRACCFQLVSVNSWRGFQLVNKAQCQDSLPRPAAIWLLVPNTQPSPHLPFMTEDQPRVPSSTHPPDSRTPAPSPASLPPSGSQGLVI